MNTIQDFIHNSDLFSYKFRLTFNRKDSYSTLFGGIMSIILRITIVYQGFGLARNILTYGKDTIQVAETAVDF